MYQFASTLKIPCILIGILCFLTLDGQDSYDTLNGRNLYRPANQQDHNSTTTELQDEPSDHQNDSVDARMIFVRDSIEARMQFVRDSIIAREIFVRDSIERRRRILDSVNFLQTELTRLLESCIRASQDDILIYSVKINIIGDSMLGDYTCITLPFTIDQPYTPWKIKMDLSRVPLKYCSETNLRKIQSIQTPQIACTFTYGPDKKILRVEEKGVVVNKPKGKLYKIPIDTILFDAAGNIRTIKRYEHYFQATANYQKGASLFIHLSEVKQFEYSADHSLSQYKIVKFCDRSSAQEASKVCGIITYGVSTNNKTYTLIRQTDPANPHADGTFTFEFDDLYNLKSSAFMNTGKSENWKTFVELNESGYVSRYVYENQGTVYKTLLINYYPNDPKATYKYETITCIFEKDGISYYQQNNTTGKTRTRDKLTMEWSPWE